MKTVNMADAAARREARRKRILENSHNRLQYISGKCSEEDVSFNLKESTNASPIPHKYENPIGTIESDSSVSTYSIPNGGLEATSDTRSLLSRCDVAAGDGELASAASDLIGSTLATTSEQVKIPLWKTIITYKYDIVLLSFLLQILHALSAIPFENTYFFIPLAIYSVTKSIWLPKQNNSSIANVLLLLNGMSSSGLHKMLNILLCTGTFSQDICIFLFTTICTQSLFSSVTDKFVT